MHVILGTEFYIEKLQPNNVFINFNLTYSPLTVNCVAHAAIHDMATHSPKPTNTSSSLVQKKFWYGQQQLFTTSTHLLLIFPFYTTLISSNSTHPYLDPIMYHFHNSHFTKYSHAFYRQSGLPTTALFLTTLPSFPLPLLHKSTKP